MTTIHSAAAECREACKDCKVGDVMQHIHHEQWLEVLIEPIEYRIVFILVYKATSEQAERLLRLRPFNREKADADWEKADTDRRKAEADWEIAFADWEKAFADWRKADADWEKADEDWEKANADRKKAFASPEMLKVHAAVCGCPWDATHDIFGNRRA